VVPELTKEMDNAIRKDMKMKSSRILTGYILMLFVVSCVVVCAEPRGPQDMGPGVPPKGSGDMHGGPLGHPSIMMDIERVKKAGANDQQIQALAEFEFEQQSKRIDLRAASEKADLKLRHLLEAKNVNEKDVMQAVETMNQARGELFKLDIVGMLKAKQVLGEDILQKLREGCPPDRMGPRMQDFRGHNEKPDKRPNGPCMPPEPK